MSLFIPTILGTSRPGRRSETVAEAVASRLKASDIMTELIDVADYPLSGTNLPGSATRIETYREIVSAADGFLIVTPEYNHGYPGELKLLLDSEFGAYQRKPVGLVSVSAGRFGGTRVIEQLKLVTQSLGMVAVSPSIHVAQVGVFDPASLWSGELGEVVSSMIDELVWYGEALGEARRS